VLVPTLQISVSYLRPTPMSRVIARGEVLRMGSATAHLQGSLRLPDGTLLATSTASAVLRPFPRP
jgi:acyl-coenzyme A thioesterase PaaI-like protein